ncbi:MAG TPA: hypothetical protein VGV57_01020 [Thermoleophilaceae bacterium]|nr:hypothetical protein [Thermoleophilaceae bacterium]
MSEAPEHDPAPSDEPDPANPHSDDLDIEGPNESAPGHAPDEPDDEREDTPAPESDR